MTPSSKDTAVMIVDDEPENLHVLEEILRLKGYQVMAFPRGDMALRAAMCAPPSVVLLDIRMPGMDGYETCRRFKADDRLRDIPVLFLSALTGAEEKLAAFTAGAVDYIPKPIDETEVHARVETHLRLRRHSLELETLVQERSATLFEAHRRLTILDGAKTDWLNMIAHELRPPLTGILGIADLLFQEVPKTSSLNDLKLVYETYRTRIHDLVEGSELLTQLQVAPEAAHAEPLRLHPLLIEAAQAIQQQTGVTCTCAIDDATEHATVACDPA